MRTITLDDSRGDFSPRDQTYIKLLERYKPFWVMIDQARVDIGIKSGQYFIKYTTEAMYKKAQEFAQDIIFIFNLPESWQHPLSDFIITNRLYSPGIGIYMSGESKVVKFKDGKPVSGRPTALKITVTQSLSLDELHKWIRDHKTELHDRLKRLPKKAARIEGDKVETRIKILDLYYQGKKPREITHEIDKLTSDESFDKWTENLTPNRISKIIARFDKVIHREV